MKVQGLDKLLSLTATKRFGYSGQFGDGSFGYTQFGDANPWQGIYQRRHRKYGTIFVRERHYWPRNPQTVPQQAWRAVFTASRQSWAALAPEVQQRYNERARRLGLPGYALYQREYLIAHG